MTASLRVLAVVPARGGSKGLPGKNIRPLAGLPLIAHSLRCAALTPEIGRTIVSTDSEEIAAVARAHGGDVPFLRPAELASDTAAMWPVIRHALAAAEAQDGTSYDAVLLLDPTSPGRLPSDIADAVRLLSADAQADGVIGVSQPEFSPYWHCVVDGDDGYLRDLLPGARSYARRQELPVVYRINASLYVWRADFVRTAENWRDGRLLRLEIPESRALHIDELEQFEIVELRLRHGSLRFPWLA